MRERERESKLLICYLGCEWECENNIPKYLIYDGQVGWLIGFYGISILVGYLMPNPVIYMICTEHFKQI